MSWIDTRGAECGARCDVSSIGLSYEGNDQKLIKVLMCGGISLHLHNCFELDKRDNHRALRLRLPLRN